MISWLMDTQPQNGLYNIGTGKARTFLDLVTAIFTTLEISPQINFVDTPADIRDKYQYFTEADMSKLQTAGYNVPISSLENGVSDYIQHFLKESLYF